LVKIAASILSADFARLGEQVDEACGAGAEYIHIDVMDGFFVPKMTIGPLVVSAIKPIAEEAKVKVDVHLMIEKPERLIKEFIQAGADVITVHVEACPHLHRTIQMIKEQGIKAGVTLNPATPIDLMDDILCEVDMVLIMSVNPGLGGQVYIPTSTDRIRRIRKKLDNLSLSKVEIEVDGGINPGNAGEIARAGASIIVCGSAIFNNLGTVASQITLLRESLA